MASTGKWHCGHGKDQMYIGGIMRVLRVLQKYNGLRKVEAKRGTEGSAKSGMPCRKGQ